MPACISDSTESEAGSDSPSAKSLIKSLTWRKRALLLSLCVADASINTAHSVLGSFFPSEALAFGLSEFSIGCIFSTLSLVQLLVYPLVGIIVPITGARVILQTGVLLAGAGTLLFGCLLWLPDATSFLMLALVLRSVIAIGTACYMTAGFVLIADEFTDYASQVFGIGEACCGAGQVLGPALGGFLHQAGGFQLPFFVIGILLMATVPLSWPCLPRDDSPSSVGSSGWDLLPIKGMVSITTSISGACTVWAMVEVSLEPHLRKFSMNSWQIGLVYFLDVLAYAASSPAVGWLCERTQSKVRLIVIGLIAISLSSAAIGPVPLLPKVMQHSVPLIVVAMAAQGLAMSLTLVPTYECMMDAALEAGHEDGIVLYSKLGSLWGTALAVGELIGPLLAGLINQYFSFRWVMTAGAAISLLPLTTIAGSSVRDKCTDWNKK